MKALRLIVLGGVLALFVLFAYSNWTPVAIVLPDGARAMTPLPVVVLVAFVLGWLPVLLIHLAARASWRRRTLKIERLLDDALAACPRVAPPVALPPTFTPSP